MENENIRTRTDEGIEIDLLELLGVLLRWIWVIVAAAVLFGAIGFCYSKFVLPEQYKSSTKVYVLNRTGNEADAPTYQDLQVSGQLTKDYAEMITSRYVLEKVIAHLQLPYGYETLKGNVSVTSPSDGGRLIQITVTDADPQMAQSICRDVREEATKHIQNVMAIDAINVVDDANLPSHKSGPSNSRNALIGALLGIVVVSAVVIVRHLLDDTIKTGDDVEKYLDMSCLALIPMDSLFAGEQKKKKRLSFVPPTRKKRT